MNSPADKRILITGASGFVGAHLAQLLARCGCSIIALGNQNAVPQKVRQAAAASARLNLLHPGDVDNALRQYSPFAIIHAAALANAALCESHPELATANNVDATSNLVNAVLRSERTPQPLLLYISTDLVFDGAKAPPGGFTETAPPCPQSIYAKTKAQAEKIVLEAPLRSKSVLRTALVYGKKIEHLGGFMNWLQGCLETGKEAPLFTDEYRSPVLVSDIAAALERILFSLSADDPLFAGQILHLAGSERISRYDFGKLTAQVFGYDPSLLIPRSRLGHPSPFVRPEDVSMSIAKVRSVLSLEMHDVLSGLQSLRPAE